MNIYPNCYVKMSYNPSSKGVNLAGNNAIKVQEKELIKSLEFYTKQKLNQCSEQELIKAIESFTQQRLGACSENELIEAFEFIQTLMKSSAQEMKNSLKSVKQTSIRKDIKQELFAFIQSVKQSLNKSSEQEIKNSLNYFKQMLNECTEQEFLKSVQVLEQLLIKSSEENLTKSQKQMLLMLKQILTNLMGSKITKFSEQKLPNGGLKGYVANWDFYYNNGLTKFFRTGNLFSERLKMTDEEYDDVVERIKGKKIFNAVIERCHKDIESAILSGESKETISKLFDTLNLFIDKYGHYNKP